MISSEDLSSEYRRVIVTRVAVVPIRICPYCQRHGLVEIEHAPDCVFRKKA